MCSKLRPHVMRRHPRFALLLVVVLQGAVAQESVRGTPSGTSAPDTARSSDDSAERRLTYTEYIESRCPGVQEKSARLKQELRSRRPTPPGAGSVTRPALRNELLMMQRRDQESRQSVMAAVDKDTGLIPSEIGRRLLTIDQANLRRLKQIISWDRFPTVAMVGKDGVDAAWLIAQHASSDVPFQRSVLRILARRVRAGEIDDQDYALLLDRVLVLSHRPQSYGTQFQDQGGHAVGPFPIADAAHVDERRHERGLIPLADYVCIMQANDGLHYQEQPAPASSHP
jgi:hypothetical protein